MILTEQNLEYVLESVIETLVAEEIEIDEELLDECLDEVLSEISSGLARRYLKKSYDDAAKKEAKAEYHNSLTLHNDGAADASENSKERSKYRKRASYHDKRGRSLENKAFDRRKSQNIALSKINKSAKVPTKG